MATNSIITDEGESAILKAWVDTLPTKNLVFYAVVTSFTKPFNEYTYADLSGITHSAVKSPDPPASIVQAQYTLPGSDKYAAVDLNNWRVVNDSGSTKSVHGFAVVDEDEAKLIMIYPVITVFDLADGGSVRFNISIYLNGDDDSNP